MKSPHLLEEIELGTAVGRPLLKMSGVEVVRSTSVTRLRVGSFWFKFVNKLFLLARKKKECFFVGSFCVFVSRLVGRRGWSSLPVPEGWVQVVRGPRPNPSNIVHQE